jgi:hypothetical protein
VKYIDSYWWYGYAARSLGLSATRQQYFFFSQQISHQQPASSTFLSEQTSISHQPPAKRTD